MEILVAIKKALKKAGIPEKYAAKVKALFNVESEENLENYVSLLRITFFRIWKQASRTNRMLLIMLLLNMKRSMV